MTTKIIPFNKETAKKIQAGEIKGKILCKNGISVKIVEFNMAGSDDIFVKRTYIGSNIEWCFPYTEDGRSIEGGCNSPDYDIVIELEVPDEPQFKPFDRVLVRDIDCEVWRASIFSHMALSIYICVDTSWTQCIPYEGNEHLLGTKNNPKED